MRLVRTGILLSLMIAACLLLGSLVFAGAPAKKEAEAKKADPKVAASPAVTLPPGAPRSPFFKTREDAEAISSGCISCHTTTESSSMHPGQAIHISCTDCHG